jgi:hypothetical protein
MAPPGLSLPDPPSPALALPASSSLSPAATRSAYALSPPRIEYIDIPVFMNLMIRFSAESRDVGAQIESESKV